MSNKLIHGWDKLQARSSIMLLIVAAVIVEVMGAVQYIFARDGIRQEVKQQFKPFLLYSAAVRPRGMGATNISTGPSLPQLPV